MERSSVKGVRWSHGKWIVKLKYKEDGKTVDKQFGSFEDREEAEELCLKLRKKYFPNERTPYSNYGQMDNKVEKRGKDYDVTVRHKDREMIMRVCEEGLEKLRSYGRDVYVLKFNNDVYYAYITYKGKQLAVHRLLTDCPKGKVVDHINHNTLDNRLCNLRNVTHKFNSNNRKNKRNNMKCKRRILFRPYKSAKGKPLKYQVRLRVDREWIHVGTFPTRIEGLIEATRILKSR